MNMIKLTVAVIALLTAASACEAETINQKIVTFLAGKTGVRVGGGECAHAANEALRVSGGEFVASDLGPDTPEAGDYVWGTLVKIVSYSEGKWTDSNPTAPSIPGDIIQYGDVKIVIGNTTFTATHHSSIVAAVNRAGLPTSVYEQNANNVRTVKQNALDLTKLVAGWVRIYRPKARLDRTGYYKFSIVNNVTSEESAGIKFGKQSDGTLKLGAANTRSSYCIEMVSSSSATAKFTLTLSTGSTIQVDNAEGYEVYVGTHEKAALRKLSP